MLSREEIIHLSFGDADPAGVVFYPRALTLAHTAVENLVRHSQVGWERWFASPTHAAPLRRAEAEFFLPLCPGERITARASVERVGKTSVTFRVDFLNAEGQTAANILTTHVLVDKATGRAVPLLDEIRSAFGA